MLRKFIQMIIEAANEINSIPSADINEINNLFKNIVDKFPQDLAIASPAAGAFDYGGSAFSVGTYIEWHPDEWARSVRSDIWKKYNKVYYQDEDFKTRVNKGRMYNHVKLNIDFLNAKVVKCFLKKKLKAFDVIVTFDQALHEISKEKLKTCFMIAKNYEQFEILVKRAMKEV